MAGIDVDGPVAVAERLEAFGVEVLTEAMNRPVQVFNGGVYLRGLLEQGPRKSLEPMVARLGEDANYQSLQQFLADSSWDPGRLVRAVAERVVPVIGVAAWVLDDTGFPKDGKHSPGVKRQYSGTLGKIGNCQIGVSLHAVGETGTVPLGWSLYLPEDWCDDPVRRKKAKIPERVVFQTKPQLGVELVKQAARWAIEAAPVLGDQAYGENTALRDDLNDAGREYVLSVGGPTTVFAPATQFTRPALVDGAKGRKPTRLQASQDQETIAALIKRLGPSAAKRVTFRDGLHGEPITSRFIFVRVRAAHGWKEKGRSVVPREEWLIAEWPEGRDEPIDYWISNLPADAGPEQLARLARLRWRIELDYRQLKGQLGLDHYEGRSWLGWYHHTALVTAAHGFLTLERQNPNHPRLA
jgi:SRSO17 transposase